MKICLINNLYQPYQRGGAEVVVKTIADGLSKAGHHVVLITLGKRAGIDTVDGYTRYRIKPFNIFSFIDINRKPIWLRLFWHPIDVFNFSGARYVKKILLSEMPDVVMTHNLKGIGYRVPRVIKKLGLRHIHTLHDVQLSRPSGLILYGQEKPFLVIDKIYEKVCRALFGSPEVVISPSQWLLRYYLQRGFFPHSHTVVMPNPVIIQKPDATHEQKFDPNIVSLLYVGQLTQSKGIMFLIDALRHFENKQWRLTIVGDGEKRAELEKRVMGDARFKFLGKLPSDKLPSFYRHADFTVVPSLCYENSPTVIFESLAANTPVIASDIGGIGEIIKDHQNGFTFVPGNEKNLHEVLRHFIAHPAGIAQLKKNCFTSVRDYSVSRYLKKLIDFLNI